MFHKTSNKIKPVEFLLNNILDKDVRDMFYPMHLMQNIFLSPKYNIRDNFVTPKGKKYNVISTCILLSILTGCACNMFAVNFDFGLGADDITSTYASAIYLFLFYYIGFIILFFVNMTHCHDNIYFILTIQNIYKNMDCSRFNRSIKIWNWISVLSAAGINIFMYAFYYSTHNYFSVIVYLCDVAFITFDINLVCAIRVIILLKKYLDEWSENILLMKSEEENVEYCKIMFHVYQKILEAFKLYKKSAQLLILFHTADTFSRTLWFMQLLISILKLPVKPENDPESAFTSFLVVLWLVKDMLLVLLQCVYCERFYISVENAEAACIQRLKNDKYPESQRDLCDNVIRLNRSSFKKMSACGLFNIDAALPLHLLEYITTYVVTLLQFAFL